MEGVVGICHTGDLNVPVEDPIGAGGCRLGREGLVGSEVQYQLERDDDLSG